MAAATAVVTTAAAMLLIDAAHDGWYRYYILEIPSGIQFFRDRLIGFWSADIVPPLLVAWLFALFYLARPGPRDTRAFHVAMATGLIASAWIPRGNPGGYVNVLIPAFLAVSVLFGLGVHAVRHAVEELPSGWRPRAELGMGLACLLQFGDLAYDPRPWLPRASDAVAGRALVRTVTAADGDVWIPYHGYISSMAGKPAYAHWMALTQVLDREADPVRASLQRQIDEALASQRYALVVGSSKPFTNAPAGTPCATTSVG